VNQTEQLLYCIALQLFAARLLFPRPRIFIRYSSSSSSERRRDNPKLAANRIESSRVEVLEKVRSQPEEEKNEKQIETTSRISPRCLPPIKKHKERNVMPSTPPGMPTTAGHRESLSELKKHVRDRLVETLSEKLRNMSDGDLDAFDAAARQRRQQRGGRLQQQQQQQPSSPPPPSPLRIMKEALLADDNSRLDCAVLTGGLTNYSYKVILRVAGGRGGGGGSGGSSTTDAGGGTAAATTTTTTASDALASSAPTPPPAGGLPPLFPQQTQQQPEPPALFAKVCFPFALWNPVRKVEYDLARVDNEYALMKKFAAKLLESSKDKGDDDGSGAGTVEEKLPIAAPYFHYDMDDSKVLVTEWSEGVDEQWANQFIEGKVDTRIVPKYARLLAKLNAMPVDDPAFNDTVRPSVNALISRTKRLMQFALNPPKDEYDDDGYDDDEDDRPKEDKCIAYLRHELGTEKVMELLQNTHDDFNRREILCHSDTHPFNVLVEPVLRMETDSSSSNIGSRGSKATPQTLFGPDGSFVLCDWEMSFVGPVGRDVGMFLPFPISCAFRHAVQGKREEAEHLLDVTVEFLDAYAAAMRLEQKKKKESASDDEGIEAFLCKQLRNAFATSFSYMLFGMYLMQVQEEFLPPIEVEVIPDGTMSLSAAVEMMEMVNDFKSRSRASVGYVGTIMGLFAFADAEPDITTFQQLRKRYEELMKQEIEELLEYHSQHSSTTSADTPTDAWNTFTPSSTEADEQSLMQHRRQRSRSISRTFLLASGRRVSDSGSLEAGVAAAEAQLQT